MEKHASNYNEYDDGYYSITSDGGSSNNYYGTQGNDYTLSGTRMVKKVSRGKMDPVENRT